MKEAESKSKDGEAGFNISVKSESTEANEAPEGVQDEPLGIQELTNSANWSNWKIMIVEKKEKAKRADLDKIKPNETINKLEVEKEKDENG